MLLMSQQNFNVIIDYSGFAGWVNRFAHAGDAAVEIAGNTAYRVR